MSGSSARSPAKADTVRVRTTTLAISPTILRARPRPGARVAKTRVVKTTREISLTTERRLRRPDVRADSRAADITNRTRTSGINPIAFECPRTANFILLRGIYMKQEQLKELLLQSLEHERGGVKVYETA